MKKETIEKLFRRYIGIYDDVVFRTTGEHISENEINTVNDQVNQLFKEYEHVETLNDFTQFTKKIQEILKNTSESASKLNKEQWEKSINEICWKFNNDPFGLIQERLDYAVKHIQVDKNDPNKFYIPADFDLLRIGKNYGIRYYYTYDPSSYVKNDKKSNDTLHITNQLNLLIDEVNKFPLQFCIETINRYFNKENGLIDELMIFKNEAKNEIIKYALSLENNRKNIDYSQELHIKMQNLKNNGMTIYDIPTWLNAYNEEKYITSFIINFVKTIPSREKILNNHFEVWEKYIKNLNKKQQKELKKRIQIIKTYKDDLTDASVIRFQNTLISLYNGRPWLLLDTYENDFIYKNILLETTLLINEMETLKFKNGELNTYTEKYSNIINELFNTVEITESNQTTKDTHTEKYSNIINELFNSIKITESTQTTGEIIFYIIKPMIEEFNKQYKYKYQWLYAKSLLKKIIKN